MKKIDQMSEEEIFNLTDEDVKELVDVACMESGVKLVVKPIEPEVEKIEGSITKFKIGLVDCLFNTVEDAQDVLKFIKTKNPYEATYRGYNYDAKMVQPYKDDAYKLNISEEQYFTPEEHAKKSAIQKANSTILTAYKEAKDEYDGALSEWNKISEDIYNKISEVRSKFNRLNRMKENYQEYLRLSENKTDEAWKYFTKAFGEMTDEEKNYILK